jgi:hypothetical protein
MDVPLAKNCTLVIVFVPPTVVVALIVVTAPTLPVEGAVMATVGPGTVVTFNVCGAVVRIVPFESDTRAVTVCEPNVVGQLAEYGEDVSAATTTPSTKNST